MQNNWPTKKLGEVIEINYGKGLPKESRIDSGKYFAYGSNGPVYGTDKSLTKSETIIIGRKGTVGALYFISDPCWPIDTTFFAKPKSDVSLKFIYYLLQTKRLPRLAIVTGVPGINRTTLANINIQLPPLATQKQIVEQLDKIAEAQKLNDELIKKTDELFQSLLYKELNPAGKGWEEDKFVNCIEENPLKIKGIPREKYQASGKFPIIDQSDKLIVGYTDDENKVYKIGFPVIIFGDHTRIFKYIDFDFAIGADGTQIVIPDRKIFIPKLFYFLMLNLRISNLGYSRHFKILKIKKLIIPPLETQKQIIAKLSAVQDYKKQLLEQKTKLKELFDSSLAKSMTGEKKSKDA